MRKFILTSVAIAAMSAATLGSANAAPNWQNGRDNHRGNDRQVVQNDRGHYVVNGHRYERQRGPAWQAPRGYKAQAWKRGQYLPRDYRRAEVRDWRTRHFSPPPRGYHYVRVGNDVVLAAIATGLITAVIANAVY